MPKLEASSIFMFFLGQFVLMGTFVFLGYHLFPSNSLPPLFFGVSQISLLWAVISISIHALWNYTVTTTAKILITITKILITIAKILITISLFVIINILGEPPSLQIHGWIYIFISARILKYYFCFLILLRLLNFVGIKHLLFSEREKEIIFPLIMGFYFSLGVTFKIFLEFPLQLHCFTLGQILVSLGIAIASLFATLIPLIYLLSKPIKIVSKYRKYEPNLIKP